MDFGYFTDALKRYVLKYYNKRICRVLRKTTSDKLENILKSNKNVNVTMAAYPINTGYKKKKKQNPCYTTEIKFLWVSNVHSLKINATFYDLSCLFAFNDEFSYSHKCIRIIIIRVLTRYCIFASRFAVHFIIRKDYINLLHLRRGIHQYVTRICVLRYDTRVYDSRATVSVDKALRTTISSRKFRSARVNT